jgi:hypothetical protein
MHFWIAFTPGSITKQSKQSAIANQQAGAGGNERQQEAPVEHLRLSATV